MRGIALILIIGFNATIRAIKNKEITSQEEKYEGITFLLAIICIIFGW